MRQRLGLLRWCVCLNCLMQLSEENMWRLPPLFVEQHDLLVAALDSVEARLFVDSLCLLHSKPWLEAGTLGLRGKAHAPVFSVYVCLFSVRLRLALVNPVCVSIRRPFSLVIFLHVSVSVSLPINYLAGCLSANLSLCLRFCPSACLPLCASVCSPFSCSAPSPPCFSLSCTCALSVCFLVSPYFFSSICLYACPSFSISAFLPIVICLTLCMPLCSSV